MKSKKLLIPLLLLAIALPASASPWSEQQKQTWTQKFIATNQSNCYSCPVASMTKAEKESALGQFAIAAAHKLLQYEKAFEDLNTRLEKLENNRSIRSQTSMQETCDELNEGLEGTNVQYIWNGRDTIYPVTLTDGKKNPGNPGRETPKKEGE